MDGVGWKVTSGEKVRKILVFCKNVNEVVGLCVLRGSVTDRVGKDEHATTKLKHLLHSFSM